jgi:hypothetical protein
MCKEKVHLQLSGSQMTKFLFALEGVGIVFVGIFLVAYLGGLPTTAVLHSEPVFRLSLTVIGLAFLVIILATVILAIYKRRT